MKTPLNVWLVTYHKENLATGELDCIGAEQMHFNQNKLPSILKEWKKKTKGQTEYITITIEREWFDDDVEDEESEQASGYEIEKGYAVKNGRYYRNAL